jgi:hypothetical protein
MLTNLGCGNSTISPQHTSNIANYVTKLFAVTITVLHCLSTQWAMGYHMWDIKPEWVPATAKVCHASYLNATSGSLHSFNVSCR